VLSCSRHFPVRGSRAAPRASARQLGLEETRAVGDPLIGGEEHDLPTLIGKSESQHFGHELAYLTRRKVHDGRHLPPYEGVALIVTSDLGAGLLQANSGSKIDAQLERWFACLRKGLRGDDGADAYVDREELIEVDSGRSYPAVTER
jgi:hypothetical protein